MTMEIDGVDIIALAETAAFVGSLVLALVAGLLVYLLVRPPRHVRNRRNKPARPEVDESQAMIELIDRMESRLETLERLMADRGDVIEGWDRNTLEPAESRESGRK